MTICLLKGGRGFLIRDGRIFISGLCFLKIPHFPLAECVLYQKSYIPPPQTSHILSHFNYIFLCPLCQISRNMSRKTRKYKLTREFANAYIVGPCQRLDRQKEAQITTKPLWRAIMSKLRRAGTVTTNVLLAISP
jgi:hypothetical protein